MGQSKCIEYPQHHYHQIRVLGGSNIQQDSTKYTKNKNKNTQEYTKPSSHILQCSQIGCIMKDQVIHQSKNG